ncbi:GNAT family N-acetyltransferase [Natronococcus occultus]|uniref:Acetyltransferase, ribosomal protein N-acetylase n=1 Tax=Natronococcus occultus SP4 TaxID=694430 RepID=L0JXK7_9EURY|nr:GNAT family N-acetyltransferase [Natronococcus occultus]AGB36598.1 acetyltransferase, ribosomal protein N-acetylase [Natronococcus occultus SP4]
MSSSDSQATGVCTAWDNSECRGTPYCPPRCPRFESKTGAALLVRSYEAGDFDPLVRMYDEFDQYSRSMGLPPNGVSKIESWLDQLTSTGWNLVAFDGDRAIGHVAVVPSESVDHRWKFLIYVHQEYQNEGVGSEMLKQLVAYADEKDGNELALEVSTGNKRAITVYKNIGFEVVERGLSELSMSLELQSPLAERLQRPPAERD